jgi:hypothetical protein
MNPHQDFAVGVVSSSLYKIQITSTLLSSFFPSCVLAATNDFPERDNPVGLLEIYELKPCACTIADDTLKRSRK